MSMVTDQAHSLPEFLVDQRLAEEIDSIPDKLAFKIGEVAEMLGVKQYVLRYWESEFESLRPKKSKTNQRAYSRKDVETAYVIRKLLHRDRFSIEGARGVFREMKGEVKKIKSHNEISQSFISIAEEIDELLDSVRRARLLFE